MSGLRLPPGPRGHWLLGSLSEFRGDLLGLYTRCARDYGDCSSFRLGPRLLCLAVHPDHVEQILTNAGKTFGRKTYILNLLVPFLGNSLLLSEGDFWLRQRRMMQPEFQRQRIVDYSRTMVDYANALVDRWQDGETRDLHADMTQLTLAIAAQTLLGADVSNEDRAIGAALTDALQIFQERWESFWPLPAFIPTPLNWRMKDVIRRLDSVVYRFINDRRHNGGARIDLLNRLLQARDQDDGRGMTDRQLRDEVLTLFLAGFETTANALAWTWYLLGRHPEVEQKLVTEVRSLQGNVTAESIRELSYTRSVFLESMRLYPPAYAIGRIALTDCELAGYRIPRGTTLIVSQWVTQRDPRFFADPLTFRPERWQDGLEARLHPYAYFPFGGGPRMCIGKPFAMMEGPLVLATLLSRVRLTPATQDDVQPFASLTLRPRTPIAMVVHKTNPERQ